MKRFILIILFICSVFLPLNAHFQMIVPDKDIVDNFKDADILIKLIFCHPFEGDVMNMEKPEKFGVVIGGEESQNLIDKLEQIKIDNQTAWKLTYSLRKPGDHVFYVEPEPYWEPAEGKFILHYAKVVVSGFGLEKGWDKKIGLKAEVVPLTRPYGIYAGNLFQGIVLVDGKPAPFVDVEVEYYNKEHKYEAPSPSFITQVIKTDADGIFSYAIPWSGWWGFAALTEAEDKLLNKQDGKYYPVEIGAIFWVNARNPELK